MTRSTASSLPLVMTLCLWVAGYGLAKTSTNAGPSGTATTHVARLLETLENDAADAWSVRPSAPLVPSVLLVRSSERPSLTGRTHAASPRIRGPTA
ncbi:MAG: hypothetical protein H6833_10485 [Planctomycetes bacterium]|nr:hypothetical protein [Planctomycetota bacterium]